MNLLNSDVLNHYQNIFLDLYVKYKNWDKSNLTFEQILEIRSHKQWETPYYN